MRSDFARTPPEIALDEPDIEARLTAHQHYVIKRTVTLRLAQMAEELALQVHKDRYTESNEQVTARVACEELMEVLATL